MVRTGNRDLIKEINLSIILNSIKSQGPLSRTEISRLSGLSLATVSGMTAELLALDFIRETAEGESTGGRPPVLLALNGRAGYVVGIKLTEQSIISALADLEANVVYNYVTSIESAQDAGSTLQAIIGTIAATLDGSGVDREKVKGIGIGLAGVIDSRTGVCRYSPILGWRNVQLARPIEEHFHLPVYIENDVNTLTIAEQWFGSGRGTDHFLVVTVGRGIGLGIVTNGQFYRGAVGGAGEFGHITLQEDGPLCECGKHGCLEAIASDLAVVRMAEQAARSGRPTLLTEVLEANGLLTLDDVIEAAQQHDAAALECLERSGRAIGIGLATLVNLFNPQMVILAGEGMRAGDARLAPMKQALRRHAFNGLADNLQLVVEPSGDETWARGAACVVLGELFKHPIHREARAEMLRPAASYS
jgi:N-acetylglucosamine repressor